MKRLLFTVAAGTMLIACKSTKYVPVIETRTDTLYISKTARDSIWLHDSIYVFENRQGDTIYVLHDRWHTKYIEKQVHDTTYISKTDTVPTPYEVIREVARKLTWWQKTRLRMGELLLGVIGVMGIIGIIRIKKKILP